MKEAQKRAIDWEREFMKLVEKQKSDMFKEMAKEQNKLLREKNKMLKKAIKTMGEI